MKLGNLYTIIIVFLLLSCKKEDSQIDYRQGWVGKYECQLVISNTHDTMTTTKNVIVYSLPVKDSFIVFTEKGLDQNHAGLYYDTLKVTTGGGILDNPSIGESIKGKFVKDSLSVFYVAPSPGTSIIKQYDGKLINN